MSEGKAMMERIIAAHVDLDRLVSAAPLMLAELERCAEFFQDYAIETSDDERIIAVEAVIAQASPNHSKG